MKLFRSPSRYTISEFDRVFLACGGCFGFLLFFYVSGNLLLSLLIGVSMGIGGNCLALILLKMLSVNGIEQAEFFSLSRSRRYVIAAVILLSAIWGCWRAALEHGAFGLFVMVLFYAQLGVLFAYHWHRHRRESHAEHRE